MRPIAVSSNPAPNYQRPLNEYADFDWPPMMSNYDQDQNLYDNNNDERLYEDTVYNEEYYRDREAELIRQSNLDLKLEELEERHIREMGEECLLLPVLIQPGESEPKA